MRLFLPANILLIRKATLCRKQLADEFVALQFEQFEGGREKLFNCRELIGMPRPEDSGGFPHPRQSGCFLLPSSTLKPSASATCLFRSRTSTSGSAISPTAYRILCVRLPRLCSRVTPLRDGINTRYGRVANPYPTGTFTRQETPSFARRDND